MSSNSSSTSAPRRGRRSRAEKRAADTAYINPAQPGTKGGTFGPLTSMQLSEIDNAAREVLREVGMSEAPPIVVDAICARGGEYHKGRLTFSADLIEEALAGFKRGFVLAGRSGGDLHMSEGRVYMGSGGAAPSVVDLETGQYRDATLRDLYDAARIVDAMENIHFFSRSVVARDMETDALLDVNTAYASLSGTAKHVFTSATVESSVQPIAEMCYALAGSEAAFRARPFLSLNINHVVSPMRFAADACGVMAAAVRAGIPVHANTFGQLGASTPVTIAGSVMQTVAETLAGMIFAWVVEPFAKITFGPRPMITDLRTGAMSGGGGEQALLMATAMQMARYYDLPSTCIAGATDSKIADAQSGFEKSLSVTLAAHAGANAITQAAGMHAGLVGCAFESYVIDNDMLGGIIRSMAPIDVSMEALSVDLVRGTVEGDGHYLGHAETLARMEKDFLYPRVADRQPFAEWEESGSQDMRDRARRVARDILAAHYPRHISETIDADLRNRFDICLPLERMRP